MVVKRREKKKKKEKKKTQPKTKTKTKNKTETLILIYQARYISHGCRISDRKGSKQSGQQRT
jgi:hypothetical protein